MASHTARIDRLIHIALMSHGTFLRVMREPQFVVVNGIETRADDEDVIALRGRVNWYGDAAVLEFGVEDPDGDLEYLVSITAGDRYSPIDFGALRAKISEAIAGDSRLREAVIGE
ncbi:MAG: hypothetical protein AB7G13_28780 [Lautropia sp.]